MIRPRKLISLFSSISKKDDGVSAVELALIAPIFVLLMFSAFEVGLAGWYRGILYESMDRGARYMRETRMAKATITEAGLRAAICDFASKGSIPCTSNKLKIALYVADDPIKTPIVVPSVIDNVTPSLTARTYILAIGYEWPFALPTSKLVMRNNGTRVQIVAQTFVTPDERPIEQ